MDAIATGRARGSRGFRGPAWWILAMLALVGAVVQACSDNKGSVGPRFPAGQTGTSDSGLALFIGLNPNNVEPGRRIGVTVVARTPNGRPVAGLHVQMSTTHGQLDAVDGFTDIDGKFATFLFVPCETPVATLGVVSAFVEGDIATGVFNVGPPGPNTPCPVSEIVPTTTGTIGGTTVGTTTGGVPSTGGATGTIGGTTGSTTGTTGGAAGASGSKGGKKR